MIAIDYAHWLPPIDCSLLQPKTNTCPIANCFFSLHKLHRWHQNVTGQITFKHFWQVILNLLLFSQGSPFFLLHKSQYLAFSNFLFGEGLRILTRNSPDFKIAFLTLNWIPEKLLKEQISTLRFIPDFIKASARFS